MKVALVTTSRADWNGLGMVALALEQRGASVVILASDHHPAIDAIRSDKFEPVIFGDIHEDREKGSSADNRLIARVGSFMPKLATALDKLSPQMLVLVGDRHEMVGVAFTAAMKGIPIAHIAGGDVSGGSLDERWRHAITKMADVHFATNYEASKRVLRMGEEKRDVYQLGSPSADRVVTTPVLSRPTALRAAGLPEGTRSFVMANWQAESPGALAALLAALKEYPGPGVMVGPNPDPGSKDVEKGIASLPPRWVVRATLPPQVYLSCLSYCLCLVGNSSSGFYEAPYYGTPVINVGDRQKGRTPHPNCMTDVPPTALQITRAMNRAIVAGRFPVENVYGRGNAADLIARTIMSYAGRTDWRKQFHD